jgi:hypothetical protein
MVEIQTKTNMQTKTTKNMIETKRSDPKTNTKNVNTRDLNFYNLLALSVYLYMESGVCNRVNILSIFQ